MDLSIVIPCRNAASTLDEQLDALLAQDWDGSWEVVVVDNGSTDATARIVQARSELDSRVRLVSATKKADPGYARNEGILSSSATAIAVCDADDVVGSRWVAAMGRSLMTHPFVTGPLELDRLNPPWIAESRGRGHEQQLPSFYGIFDRAPGCNVGFLRSWWEELGGFNEEIYPGEDMMLSLEMWVRGVPLHWEPAASVHHRYRTDTGALWRQGRAYGRARVAISSELRRRQLPTPSWHEGWRSWIWSIRHLPDLRHRPGRASWVWVAGNRVGQVEGSVRHRIVQL